MQQQPQKQQKNNSPMVAMALMRTMAATLYLPIRTRMGRDHLGLSVVFGCALIFVWSQITHASELTWLIPIDLAAWGGELIGQAVRRWQGIQEHTEYGGSSWLCKILFRDEELAKQFGEPLLSVLIGTLLYYFSPEPNAATYFWWGGGVMFMWHRYCKEQCRRLVDQMNNVAMDNDYLSSKMKRRF